MGVGGTSVLVGDGVGVGGTRVFVGREVGVDGAGVFVGREVGVGGTGVFVGSGVGVGVGEKVVAMVTIGVDVGDRSRDTLLVGSEATLVGIGVSSIGCSLFTDRS